MGNYPVRKLVFHGPGRNASDGRLARAPAGIGFPSTRISRADRVSFNKITIFSIYN